MKRFLNWLLRLFFPPAGSTRLRRVMPFVVMGLLTIIFLVAVGGVWEYTNSNEFCGTACHTMPPQYSTYLVSPHAGINCVECHLGRASIPTQIIRKAEDGILTLTGLVLGNYEYPLRAHNMRPANEACTTCHNPEKLSMDSFREIVQFKEDKNNTAFTTYLILKTGGGTKRQGLGNGIHWHIENPVYFYTEDETEQDIPYVRVVDGDGVFYEYVDVESDFDINSINEEELRTMDCITCHNRITHTIYQPERAVDQLLQRGRISTTIPNIRVNAVEALGAPYSSNENALNGIDYLADFYQEIYPKFYSENAELIDEAIAALQETYELSVFPEHGIYWDSYADNLGHRFSAGCFRCHGGKHLNSDDEAIRLECNLCHSIPVVVGPDVFLAKIEIDLGPEPSSHLNPNWMTLHREVFDPSCENCHTVENPGGVSDTSFCSNSACHGYSWDYAGFDAPGLREALGEQLDDLVVVAPGVAEDGDEVTYDGTIAVLLEFKCVSCHNPDGIKDLDLTTYTSVMAGSTSGETIIPGDPENSLFIQVLSGEIPHFAQFTTQEMKLLTSWIEAGAPQN